VPYESTVQVEPIGSARFERETATPTPLSSSCPPVRVLVVDRPGWVYFGSTAVSSDNANLEVVGRALDAPEAARLAALKRPDVLVVNLPSDPHRAIDTIQELKRTLPDIRIVAFSSIGTQPFVRLAFDAGVAALLGREDDPAVLVEVIRTVRSGKFVAPSAAEILGECATEASDSPAFVNVLTPREWSVLKLIAQGLNSRQMGVRLGIQLTTVHAHRANVMKKLNLHKASLLTEYCLRYQAYAP
jgi:DNA-binding NarL/FixJ family response regulator